MRRTAHLVVTATSALLVVTTQAFPVLAVPGTTELVSVSSSEAQSNGNSFRPAISGDGRFIAFSSEAGLVPDDTNGGHDIYLRDRQLGTTERVSVDSDGNQATGGGAGDPEISADGRFVAFASGQSTLVSGDTNGTDDIFVHDRLTGDIERVSVSSLGVQGNNYSTGRLAISDDGRFVVFSSVASNLVPGDTNDFFDVFVRDRQTATTVRISESTGGGQSLGGNSSFPAISGDGRFVVFESFASNLVAGDTNGVGDAFLRDMQLGTTTRVSLGEVGNQLNGDTGAPSITDDGRYVSFNSTATNAVAGDGNGFSDIFVRDLLTGNVVRASVSSAGVEGNSVSTLSEMSADGHIVSFISFSNNLTPSDGNGFFDVFVRDLATSKTELVSVSTGGASGNQNSDDPALSSDGSFVTFGSSASDLIAADANGNTSDIFVRERAPAGDSTPPTVTCDPMPTFVVNQPGATVSATVDDGESGPESPVVSASVSTAAAGTYTVELTGSDNAGNSTTVDCPYSVGYNFTGFFSPIDNPPIVNKANAGETIPVKWRITDYNGVGISDPASFVSLTSGSTTCSSTDPTDVIETYSGGSGLQYQGDGNWQFNWKTPKSYAGQCRTMRLNLADSDTSRIGYFQFK